MNRQILKEAIAEAKTVKDTAIANAKIALEEAFEPHLKTMLAAKLQEMEDEEIVDEEITEEEDMEDLDENLGEDLDEEMDLDSVLAELERELEEDLHEAEDKAKDKAEDKAKDKAEDKAEDEDEETESEPEEEDEEVDLDDMTEDDLKSFIEDVIQDMVASGELEAGEGEEMGMDDEGSEEEMGEFDLDMDLGGEGEEEEMVPDEEIMELKRTLYEAFTTIKALSSELKEIKLLNIKMNSINQLFKSKSLNEAQKVKVLEAFDKTKTEKEAKLVFEALDVNLSSTPKYKIKRPISEHLIGGASRATNSKIKAPIVAEDEMVQRFQKLAGIK